MIQKKLFLLFLIALSFSVEKLYSQDNNTNLIERKFSISTGFGGSSFGPSGYIATTLHQNKNAIGFSFLYSKEANNTETSGSYIASVTVLYPAINVWAISIFFNRVILQRRNWQSVVGIGTNYAQGTLRGDFLYKRNGGFSGDTKYYRPVYFSVVGLDMNVTEHYKINNYFGIELIGFANFNPQKNNRGLLLGIDVEIPFKHKNNEK